MTSSKRDSAHVPRRTARCWRWTCGAFVLGVLAAGGARASGTDPILALTQAEVFPTSAGATVVAVRGTLPVADYVQVDFPAGLFVSNGSSWARYEFGGDSSTGSDASVADGVSAPEMLALIGAGSPAPAPTRVVRTALDRIDVVLPPALAGGTVSLFVYAVLDGDAFLSNVLTVVVP